MSDKLDLQSPDLVNQNIEKLAALFPNCVTEAMVQTSTGAELRRSIDFDLLRQELSHQVVEGTKERYRLEWPGKKEAIVTANLPTTKTLRPVREDSVDFDTTENLYIEGDNLEVLKLLQESYLGKIKMIYIDPPYNTGKDFVYKDNFSRDTEKELLESGQKDDHNKRLVINPDTAGRYHSDWLSMMYPRLKLAKNLLSEDGLIFISIDDYEVHNLRKLCDDPGIFGEQNFIAQLIWKRRVSSAMADNNISTDHEYVLCYQKGGLEGFIGFEKDFKKYSNPDNDPRGPWMLDNLTVGMNASMRPNQAYDLVDPKTGKVYPFNPNRVWAFIPESMSKMIEEGRIFFPEDTSKRPMQKRFKNELKSDKNPFSSIMIDQVGLNTEATREIQSTLGGNYFDYSKPTSLLKTLISQVKFKNGDVVLDFFAGSSTTATSTLSLNAEDLIKRKFILVQLPEKVDESDNSYSAGFKNICEIGKERIRRAANKIKEETGADIDYGFRVYRLDSSNMQDVYYRPQDMQQGTLDMFADHIKSDRTADDLLAQVMLDWGLPLSLKIEQKSVAGKKVFQVAGNSLMACFDSGIDEAFAKEIAADKPLRIVFRDASFRSDTAKENVKQLLKQLSPETEMKVI